MNPQDPNQGGMGGGMPTGDQGGQAPVADPNAGQPVAETPAPEAPVTPEMPTEVPGQGEPEMGGDQNGQNPGGAPVV